MLGPLTNHVRIPLKRATAAVMNQVDMQNSSCALATTIVTASLQLADRGSKYSARSVSVNSESRMKLPIESIYSMPDEHNKSFIATQVSPIRTVVIRVIRHWRDSFFTALLSL